MYGTNICDSSFDGANYCRRLEKYAFRGFRVGVPGFEEHKVSHKVLEPNYVLHERNDLMLRMDHALPSFRNGSTEIVGIGTPVWHFERLVVLALSPHKVRFRIGQPRIGDSDTDSDEDYSPSPDVAVSSLLERCQLFAEEGGLPPGGAIAKGQALNQVRKMTKYCVGQRLASHTQLQFVYDFCCCATPFSALRFVNDAARPPLDDCEAFNRIYGIDQRLTFSEAGVRVRKCYDWWQVYE